MTTMIELKGINKIYRTDEKIFKRLGVNLTCEPRYKA